MFAGGPAARRACPRGRLRPPPPFADATALHLGNFIDALAQNKTPAGTARDHRKTLALVFAAYDSAAAGCSIELAPYLASAAVSPAVHV